MWSRRAAELTDEFLQALIEPVDLRPLAWRSWAASQDPAMLDDSGATKLTLVQELLEELRPRMLQELTKQFLRLRGKETERSRQAHAAVQRINAHFAHLANKT